MVISAELSLNSDSCNNILNSEEVEEHTRKKNKIYLMTLNLSPLRVDHDVKYPPGWRSRGKGKGKGGGGPDKGRGRKGDGELNMSELSAGLPFQSLATNR